MNIDGEIFSQKNFAEYSVLQGASTLILDSVTLKNLDILENRKGGVEGKKTFGNFFLKIHRNSLGIFGSLRLTNWKKTTSKLDLSSTTKNQRNF